VLKTGCEPLSNAKRRDEETCSVALHRRKGRRIWERLIISILRQALERDYKRGIGRKEKGTSQTYQTAGGHRGRTQKLGETLEHSAL